MRLRKINPKGKSKGLVKSLWVVTRNNKPVGIFPSRTSAWGYLEWAENTRVDLIRDEVLLEEVYFTEDLVWTVEKVTYVPGPEHE